MTDRFFAHRRIARAALLAMLAALPLAAQAPGSRELKVGSPAPVITVAALDGKPVRIGAVIGQKGAVVEFWATWCELCAQLMPRMQSAKTRFADRFDFYGVNVTVSDSKAHVQRYVTEHKPPFVTLYDETGLAVRTFVAPATSHVVIIDQKGIVRYIGDGGEQDISAALERILKP